MRDGQILAGVDSRFALEHPREPLGFGRERWIDPMGAPAKDHVVDEQACPRILVPCGHVAKWHEPGGKKRGLQAGTVGGTMALDVLDADAAQVPEREGKQCPRRRCRGTVNLHILGVHALMIHADGDGLAGLRASEMMRRISESLLEVAHDDHGLARALAVESWLDDGDIIFLHLAECRRRVLVEGLERGHDADRGVARRPRAAGVDGHEHGGLALVEKDVLAGQNADGIQPDGLAHGLRLDARRPGLGPHEPDLASVHAHEICKRIAEEP